MQVGAAADGTVEHGSTGHGDEPSLTVGGEPGQAALRGRGDGRQPPGAAQRATARRAGGHLGLLRRLAGGLGAAVVHLARPDGPRAAAGLAGPADAIAWELADDLDGAGWSTLSLPVDGVPTDFHYRESEYGWVLAGCGAGRRAHRRVRARNERLRPGLRRGQGHRRLRAAERRATRHSAARAAASRRGAARGARPPRARRAGARAGPRAAASELVARGEPQRHARQAALPAAQLARDRRAAPRRPGSRGRSGRRACPRRRPRAAARRSGWRPAPAPRRRSSSSGPRRPAGRRRVPKTSTISSQCGQGMPDMFSTTPTIFWWVCTAMEPARSATSAAACCGVVTTRISAFGTSCATEIAMSPVPGGRSSSSTSRSPQ